MLTPEKLAEIRKLRDYCEAILGAHVVAAEPEPEASIAPDLLAWKTSQQNKILASAPGSAKAELLGTLTTLPTITAKAFTDLDCYPSLGDDVIKAAAELRAWALARTDVKAPPLEEIKP